MSIPEKLAQEIKHGSWWKISKLFRSVELAIFIDRNDQNPHLRMG